MRAPENYYAHKRLLSDGRFLIAPAFVHLTLSISVDIGVLPPGRATVAQTLPRGWPVKNLKTARGFVLFFF
jgi:hypothetical protein